MGEIEERRELKKIQEELEQLYKEDRVVRELEEQMDYQSKKDWKLYKGLQGRFSKDKKIQKLCQDYLQESGKNGRKRNDLVVEYQKLNYERRRKLEDEVRREKHESNLY